MAAFRKKKLGVLVRNFWVATYRNPTGIRQKGKKGIYWLLESKNNQHGGRRGFRDKWGKGHRTLGLSLFQSPSFSLGDILSCITRVMACKYCESHLFWLWPLDWSKKLQKVCGRILIGSLARALLKPVKQSHVKRDRSQNKRIYGEGGGKGSCKISRSKGNFWINNPWSPGVIVWSPLFMLSQWESVFFGKADVAASWACGCGVQGQQWAHLEAGICYGVTLRGDYRPNERHFKGGKEAAGVTQTI